MKFRDTLGHQISAPKTTSDWRAIKNFESELKGRGFVNQQTSRKVKDALVKNTNVTALPASNTRKTANQQTTFKQFTQRFQPNVQGPRKPNSPVVQKQGRVQGPESELAHRHRTAFDKRLDAVIKDIRGTRVKPLSDAEMAKLRRLNLTPSQKRKFREMGLLEDNKHRDAKLNYQYKQVTNPKPVIKPLDVVKQKKGLV